jgi:hypothetical protein
MSKWPKPLPELTPEQRRISDEFMKLWHEVLPRRFGLIEKFNHGFPVERSPEGFKTTLEIGAGLGEHLAYERLTPEQERGYYCNELRANMALEIRRRRPGVRTVVGDCQKRLDFPDGFFDRVLAIHVLEHLCDLPSALAEVHRLLEKKRGRFLAVIPTEGGPAYALARKMSAERLYKKRFGGDYSWFYRREHVNRPAEILSEIEPFFSVESRAYFPLRVPFVFCNLCIGLELKARPTAA